MARARMVSASISNSEKLAKLSTDGARLLFTWMILHADNLGRLRGEPIQVKATVLPRHPSKPEEIELWLAELAQVGLVDWYEHQGQRFLAIKSWSAHNKLVGNMRATSELPALPKHVHTSMNAVRTCSPEVEVEVEEKRKEVEAEGEEECRGEGAAAVEENPAPSRLPADAGLGTVSPLRNGKSTARPTADETYFERPMLVKP